jgi:hypothetical protein
MRGFRGETTKNGQRRGKKGLNKEGELIVKKHLSREGRERKGYETQRTERIV